MMVMASSAPVMAEGTAGDYFTDMGKQVYRGLRDVLTSPAEIPCAMSDDIKADGPVVGTASGLGKGLAFMVKRLVIGVVDVGTFLIPRSEPSQPLVCTDPKV